VLDDVRPQPIAVAAGEALQPIDGPMRPLTDPVGVAVGDEQALEAGLDQLAESVVDHPILKTDGADLAPLGVLEVEVDVGARTVGPGNKLGPQLDQVFLRSILEAGDARRAALAARRLAPGEHQVLPGAQVLEGGAHHGARPFRCGVTNAKGGSNMDPNMVIFSRTFDLLEWLLPKSERFPRAYRSTVTQRLMDAALDLQEALVAAESRGGRLRVSALRDADAALGRLRIYLRLAHRWHWLSDGQYEHTGRMVAEIGRLLGGWLRSERA